MASTCAYTAMPHSERLTTKLRVGLDRRCNHLCQFLENCEGFWSWMSPKMAFPVLIIIKTVSTIPCCTVR